MSILPVRVNNDDHREKIERNSIAMLSNYLSTEQLDKFSIGWVGCHSSRAKICNSGLWSVTRKKNYESYDPSFLTILEKYIKSHPVDAFWSDRASLASIASVPPD